MATAEEFKTIGAGRAVFTRPEPVEGPVAWLDSPQAVIQFVQRDDVADTIVLARGGTTTFLTPALTAGVKGVITLQGAPESHLGILSREYGIPCVMGVQFEDGVRSSRGEIIPADGAVVRLDISTPEGRVAIEPGAPSEGGRGEPTAEEQALAAQMEQVIPLLHHFRGEVPHGAEGDQQLRDRLKTDVSVLSDESLRRRLTPDEINDFNDYAAWNVWDALALRSTEGESGLIPRQEYEAFGCINQYLRFPTFVDVITEKLGVDGVIELGAIPRREPGSKVNQLHLWCSAITPLFGRGLLHKLGLIDLDHDTDGVEKLVQFQRRLMAGFWGDGGELFSSSRGYRAPVLDRSWIDRFAADVQPFSGDDQRGLYQRFNATTEITGFLLHFDNRSGLCDSGPYPLPDGGFMIVRDHFLHDPAYHWHDVAEDLPHALTQAMVFHPKDDLQVNVLDIGTLFSEPSNYLDSLTGMAVYARDRYDTPVEELRRVDEDEMRLILERCDTTTTKLYKRIASMSPRDKIMCGAQVYYTEFVAPMARRAGVWEQLVEEHDFFEIDPLAMEAYYPLVRDKQAAAIVPQAFLMGLLSPPVSHVGGIDASAHAEHFPLLHRIALRGMLPDPPQAVGALAEAGLVATTAAGALLSEAGTAVHQALLAAERGGADTERLQAVYDRFLPINGDFKAACARWHDADEGARAALLADLSALVDRVEPALRRSGEVVARFADYGPRLRAALSAAEAGDHEQVTSPQTDSLHTVWMELHEDYIQILEIDRELEGSY
ncbi:PEP-utilizing enzyme [Conexibacter sp. W3-3-2]|uniref:PEP-utilizing enzyme n=1 Tax=Conexibacter sp. W3-3-2 TaxID=2675227 RepID=UPI001E5FC3CC|nr:PEP-utilizing enzyme [Conexibacter sp. W3-3-2]